MLKKQQLTLNIGSFITYKHHSLLSHWQGRVLVAEDLTAMLYLLRMTAAAANPDSCSALFLITQYSYWLPVALQLQADKWDSRGKVKV